MADEKDPTADEPNTDPTAEETTVTAEEPNTDPTASDPAAEPVVETKAAPVADNNAELTVALKQLNSTLARRDLTPEQQEAAWQKLEADTGQTRQQIMFNDQRARSHAVMANLDTNRELGKMKADKILGDEHADLAAEIEKTMLTLPPEIQANPKAWEDAAYLAVGRKSKMTKKTETPSTRRIVTGAAPTTKGAAPAKKPELKNYSAMEQALINSQFAGKADEYEKYKNRKSVADDSKYTARAGANTADAELEKLTAGNS